VTAATVLRGITWDHPRGLGGLQATAAAWTAARPGVRVEWTTRSLQAFADQPVDELARRFDLICLDHPAVGEAVARSCLVPLDEHLDPAAPTGREALALLGALVARCHPASLDWDPPRRRPATTAAPAAPWAAPGWPSRPARRRRRGIRAFLEKRAPRFTRS
jgi:multiple sugar transport system substrate-binding protein